MKPLSITILCAVFVSAFFFVGCKTYDNDSNVVRQMQNENQNSKIANIGDDQNEAKDNEAELLQFIRIPFETEEAIYKIEPLEKNPNSERAPGPTDSKLIAVIKFKPEDAQKVLEQAKTYKQPIENSLNVENWYPPELVAKSQESGDESVKGEVYAPNDFTQTPYLNGTLTHITGTDYFVLELITQ